MNRFIRVDDEKINKLGDFVIPPEWWSRPSEYAWAASFLKKGEFILDAGCGIEHPFKFHAAKVVDKVFALDNDSRINDLKHDNIEFYCGALEDTAKIYPAQLFDKIFCISVLEHTKHTALDILRGFEKCLKNDGQIIITIDYPLMTPEELKQFADISGLQFVGAFDFETSKNDLVGYHQNYRIFRAVFEKVNKTIEVETKPIEPQETKPFKPKERK